MVIGAHWIRGGWGQWRSVGGGGSWDLLEVIGVNWGIIRTQWGSMCITGGQWE